MGMLRHVDIVGVCFDFFACVPLLNLFVCCICLLVCCFGSIAAFIHTYPKGIAAHTHFQTILACGKGSSRARWFDVDSTLLVMVITMRGVIIKTMISYNQGWLQMINDHGDHHHEDEMIVIIRTMIRCNQAVLCSVHHFTAAETSFGTWNLPNSLLRWPSSSSS